MDKGRGWKGALIDKNNNFKPIRNMKQRIFWTVIAPVHIPLASIAFFVRHYVLAQS